MSQGRAYYALAVLCVINLLNYLDRYILAGVMQQLQKTFAELQGSHALVNVRAATNDMKTKGYKLGTLAQ